MRTFLQVQTDVFTQLKEDAGTTGYWITSEVKDAINDTYAFIADETHCFRLKSIIEVKSGIRIYKLPANYINGSLDRVEFDSEKIYPISSDELDAHSSSWRNESGDPSHYFPPGDICNIDELALYPKPDTDGNTYILAGDAEDVNLGVITAISDDSYEEFNEEEGIIADTSGESVFEEEEGSGPVLEIEDPTNNIRIFAAKYPKRLHNDNEVFLAPISHNPKKILTKGALSILFAKEGEGKDIAKASYYNKRFMEAIARSVQRPSIKRAHKMRSITEISTYGYERGTVNLGSNYPSYFVR